jgi:hypothetical protein
MDHRLILRSFAARSPLLFHSIQSDINFFASFRSIVAVVETRLPKLYPDWRSNDERVKLAHFIEAKSLFKFGGALDVVRSPSAKRAIARNHNRVQTSSGFSLSKI